MDNVIETKNLTKRFGGFTAVDNVSLTVGKGEIYGFLGLNGAGKTTTIRMLLGMIRPTKGECLLNGKRASGSSNNFWNSVGYLVEIPYSYPDLTVRENLELLRHLRFIGDKKSVDRAMEFLNITRYAERRAKDLSLGNAQRLGLAKALFHNPDILILDEPANGLDPAGIVEIRELLLDLVQKRGATVFISSHILGEISKFATRIGIIHEGRLLQELTADDLERVRNKRLLVAVHDDKAAQAALLQQGIAARLAGEGLLEITADQAITNPDKINATLVKSDNVPSMVRVEEEDLESYFLRIIGKN
ncbi:MAG TPA: ABC transporter ATP-binding protein [Chitinivibrionales bacterium]|nr:ABC transporter ATP-binding protein [Chitinivibrionales bacterium]